MVESMAASSSQKADEEIPPTLKVYPVACLAHSMMMMVQK